MRIVLSFILIISAIHCMAAGQDYSKLYSEIKFKNNKPAYETFSNAMAGFDKLKLEHKLSNTSIITIIDLGLPSTKRRLWIIDLEEKRVLENSLVAHGKNTGSLYAEYFSNVVGSKQSSLGFYVTGGTYHGKHGLSLYLNGVEPGINDKARERAIVLHGATYVSQEFIEEYGRLGRSFGCPAVPISKHRNIINTIKNGSCLFIYYPSQDYLDNSEYVASVDL